MKKDKLIITSLIVVIIIIITIFIYFVFIKNDETDSGSLNKASEVSSEIKLDNGDENVNWDKYDTTKITLSESLEITKGGIYELTGTLNGSIKVNCDDYVKIILNNVNITSTSGPAIYIESAKTTVIETTSGTTNTLTDSESLANSLEDVNSVIYSKDDLVLSGDGTLVINGKYEDGIVSKDDLKINGGTIKITTVDDAIRGKDSIYIKDGNITINASGDGIKTTNDTDSSKGYIYITGGKLTINATNDAIESTNIIKIDDGEFSITTGGGSKNTSTSDTWGMWNNKNTSTDTPSAKGIKCDGNIVINGGIFNFDTSDDAIHSNGEIGIISGEFNISSGDDGIHADSKLLIDDGIINIKKSYEGLESEIIVINGGDYSIISSDDGINVAGGNDSSSTNRAGANNFNTQSNASLTINGGNLYVSSSGDALDSNGSIYQNGGNVVVDGPTNDGNAALDYDKEYIVNGGTLIASGTSGMALSVSSQSKIYNISMYLDSTYESGTLITIKDSNDNEILNYTSTKAFNHMTFASDKLENNETYTVLINNQQYKTFTISSITTTIGTNTNSGMQNRNGGMRR